MKPFFTLLQLFIAALLLLIPRVGCAQLAPLQGKIKALTEGKQLRAGIALCDLSTGDTLTLRGGERFPMMSVFKFPLALAVLHHTDQGKWSLNEQIQITTHDLPADTWSPLRERYPKGASIPIAELLRYTVSQSDNNGCDILLRLVGGPTQVDNYLRRLGIRDIAIVHNEAAMHRDPQCIHDNYATPCALLQLLRDFDAGGLLRVPTQAFLQQTLAETSTGSVRTQLPPGTVVAHKTGSSGRDEAGIAAATNDVGILHLPSGGRIAYVIFLADSHESDEVTQGIIAQIAHLIYTEYQTTTHHE